jgi:hypothetical protein
MIQSIRIVLINLESLLIDISNETYIKPSIGLSNGFIGEHVRHIIEMYQCLHIGYIQGSFSYDKRKRDKSIEQDKNIAILAIHEILNFIDLPDKTIKSEYELLTDTISIETTYFRELLHNLEHTIHHQALIKVALIEFNITNIAVNFGVAPSTILYKRACVQ